MWVRGLFTSFSTIEDEAEYQADNLGKQFLQENPTLQLYAIHLSALGKEKN